MAARSAIEPVPGHPAQEGRPAARLYDRVLPSLKAGLVILPGLGLLAGLGARYLAGAPDAASAIWALAAAPVLAALLLEIAVSLRRGEVGLDIVAALAMGVALLLGETLAAVVVALMYAGGQYLESYAEGRASREMTALLARVPRTAVRHRDGGLETVLLDAIAPGDRILVPTGETVPVDGRLASPAALLDQAAITGESLPVSLVEGAAVLSGSSNLGGPIDVEASRRAAESTLAGIVRLVEEAHRSKAPVARLADRFAIGFLALTVALAGAAWLATGDPGRLLAVLVVATPCPLILAVPVALVSGVSRAARFGILVKGGRALEALWRVKVLVLDKTGTLTQGRPRLSEILAEPGFSAEDVLRMSAALDQASHHVVAASVVAEARERGLRLPAPAGAIETAGAGIEGMVEGRRVVVGGTHFVLARSEGGFSAALPPSAPGALVVAVAIEGRCAGRLVLTDPVRPGTADLLAALRRGGVARLVLATGDRRDIAERTAATLPLDTVHAELTPAQKIAVVQAERAHGPVMMVGDGVNDAPALAAADLGVAMGATGAAASAQAADVVLLVDRLDRIGTALSIARRTRAIAMQSVLVGLGLSLAGMVAAALGYLSPVQGALLQEAIDAAVILNALRALGGEAPPVTPDRSAARAPAVANPPAA